MRSLLKLAFAGMLCLGMAGAVTLGGCSTFNAVFGAPSTQAATTVGAAENAYTVTAHLATAYLKSGRATPAQATTIKAADAVVYGDLVVARRAVAAGDSPAVAIALKSFNEDLPKFAGQIPSTGGGQ